MWRRTDVRFESVTETSKTEFENLREEVARLVIDMDEKCDRGLAHTSEHFKSLEAKLEFETAARNEETATERDVRSREVGDICNAVKSMQEWIADVENTATQRNEVGIVLTVASRRTTSR